MSWRGIKLLFQHAELFGKLIGKIVGFTRILFDLVELVINRFQKLGQERHRCFLDEFPGPGNKRLAFPANHYKRWPRLMRVFLQRTELAHAINVAGVQFEADGVSQCW